MPTNYNTIADMHAATQLAISLETPAQRAARLANHAASILAAQNFIGNHGNQGNRHPDNIAADRRAATLVREQQDAIRTRNRAQIRNSEINHGILLAQPNENIAERIDIENAIRKVAEYENGQGSSRTGRKSTKRKRRRVGSKKYKR